MGGRKRRNISLKESIYIVGEGITEQYYFSHLKQIQGYSCVVKPRFFGNTNIFQIAKAVNKLRMGGVTVICVFDADVSQRNEEENKKLIRFKQEYKYDEDVIICDSLPSIEFWFLIHYVKTNKYFIDSRSVEKALSKYLNGYDKTQRYLQNRRWVEELCTKLETAITHAKSLENHKGRSYSHIYRAIEKLASEKNP